ncbi:MAG: alpha-1,2-fucosyltransferase [Phycisphaerae bacterium]|nr:alpha-1,2-fucosyltransferase [Phycisphaerae bacterium]
MTLITVRLAGGLGNQLFQYAAARAAALVSGATVALDTSSFAGDPLRRRYALSRFPIQATQCDLRGWRRAIAAAPGLWRVARRTGVAPRVGDTRFLFDRMRGFDPRVLAPVPHLVLTGYWQDAGYFTPHAATLDRELDPSSAFPAATRDLGAAFADEPTLALHVRRSDFTRSDSPHGSCSPAYYRAAANWIRGETFISRVIVFTDDPTWAHATLDLDVPFETLSRANHPTLVDPPQAPRGDDEDLWLMSRCRHVVIANSSFSWWAAWMAERRAARVGTIIACPSRWYRASAGPIPHPAPPGWRRIKDPDALE